VGSPSTSPSAEPSAALRADLLAGVELGGTKILCLVGTGPDDVRRSARIDVREPGPTLAEAVAFFRAAAVEGLVPRAVGIGSFGPVDLDPHSPGWGHITSTPKPGWSRVDVVGPFIDALGVPAAFDTDVNAAALAEGRWGAARGLTDFVYLTVGTGIGGGAVVGGRVVHGLGHPEMGHIAVPRVAGDDFPGRCPFHGDCLEGMASGPAVGDRFGRRAETLTGADRARAVDLISRYLAAGLRSIAYVLAPQRFVLGGGLASMPGVVEATALHTAGELRDYPGIAAHQSPGFVVAAGLGGMAGPSGTLLLAEMALSGG
jgi:fructokinase